MILGEVFRNVCEIKEELRGLEVTGVTSDSREVREGSLFVAIEGRSFDGHSFAEDMLKKGACAVVTQRLLGLEREITVADSREIYSHLLSEFYGRPTDKIKLGAVTGTNGKTTVVNLCGQITRLLGHQTAIIGTLGTDTGRGLVYSHEGPPTNPEPKRLYELFTEMAEIGTRYCFMEASSQALAQYRFSAERFAAAAFTNLTRDHLDYHGTMEDYFLAKRSLFDMGGAAVVNIDDEYGRNIAEYCREKNIPLTTTSVHGTADYYTEMVRLFPDRAEFILTDSAAKKSYPVRFAMTGLYNVSNAVQAAVMCVKMGFELSDILEALEKISGVGGRLETLYSGDFTVIRDYAHTEDGLEQLLSTLKPLAKGRLITLFGAAGERDAGKRPAMGAAAAKYSDHLIVTTDSPRHEDPQKTVDDVAAGIPTGMPWVGFTDRREAIFAALDTARSGDIVALCGKGHEDYQAIGDEYLHFDEKEIVDEWVKRGK